ncbi:glutathione S-transferase N-terminal domain-containing protein, partial [Escherichia coli]|uniref:glutathione S-transferase N-terminal domain-containing protein n=1 Tax=Escherichia coli TaxID=562 RepID=UPI0013D6400E
LQLVEERSWARREEFLLLNPAGTTPVLVSEGAPAIPGASVIVEFLDETLGYEMGDNRLMMQDVNDRIEVRRLMTWFNEKFFEEVSY